MNYESLPSAVAFTAEVFHQDRDASSAPERRAIELIETKSLGAWWDSWCDQSSRGMVEATYDIVLGQSAWHYFNVPLNDLTDREHKALIRQVHEGITAAPPAWVRKSTRKAFRSAPPSPALPVQMTVNIISVPTLR